MKKVQLNKTQQEVFNRLKAFVKDKNIDTFILNGYAGTGKTFLMQYFAEYLKKQKIEFKLLATTGRAAAVLRGKTELTTGTVHGALYSFSKVDGDSEDIPDDAPADDYGQMKLIFAPNKNLDQDSIYIVDESSMLASEEFDSASFAQFGSGRLLNDFLYAAGKSKIIFVGDSAQLPPIGQDTSPALDKNWLNKHGRITVEATLDEIMRTDKDNDILVMAEEIRKKIGTPSTERWIKLPAQNRTNCTVLPDRNTIFLEYYAKLLQYGSENCIAIAHSNAACNYLNHFVRRRLFPKSNQLIEVGEVLMVTQNNYIVPLTNGDFVQVVRVGEMTSTGNLKFQNVRVKRLNSKIEYEIKLALDPFVSNLPNLTPDQQRHLMIDYSRRMRKKGVRPNSDEYKDVMRKDPFLNCLRANYGYVVTCHKAQGGEWKEVFLFLDSKMYGYLKPNEMRRWWYTAVTRSKEHLYLHQDWWIT